MRAVRQIETPLLFGMMRFAGDAGPEVVNSAVLVDGGQVQATDKVQLAPWVERSIPFLRQTDVRPGRRTIVELGDGTRLLVLICYEGFFPINSEIAADAVIVIAAETGFADWQTKAVRERHRIARSLETDLPVIWVSDRESD